MAKEKVKTVQIPEAHWILLAALAKLDDRTIQSYVRNDINARAAEKGLTLDKARELVLQ